MSRFLSRINSVSAALFLLFSLPVFAVEDLSSSIYNIEMDTEMVNNIHSYLPENGGLNPAFISNTTDPNIHLLAEADVSLTFIDEGAGYKNSFGLH